MSGGEVEKTNNQINLPETLTVQTKHCVLIYNLINVVTKRGAINSDEFSIVGEVVDALKKELRIDEQIKNKQNNEIQNNSDKSQNVD